MITQPTMRAAVLDAYGTPFRVAAVTRPAPAPGRSWCGSPPVASIRSTSKSMPAPPNTPDIRCRPFSASTSPAWSRRSARVSRVSSRRRGVRHDRRRRRRQGSLAEYAAVDADLLALKPAHLSMREARTATGLHHGMGGPGGPMRASAPDKPFWCWAAPAVWAEHGDPDCPRPRGQVSATGRPTPTAIERSGRASSTARSRSRRSWRRHTAGRGFDLVFDTVGGPVLDDIVHGGAPFWPRGQRARLGHACPGAALVPRRHVLGRLHPASATDRRRPHAPRRDPAPRPPAWPRPGSSRHCWTRAASPWTRWTRLIAR